MEDKKQTAVESLEEQIVEYFYMCIIESTDKDNRYVKIDTFRIKAMFDRVKAMEKEQIMRAYTKGYSNSNVFKNSEQYYNESFKSE